ncbi:MAG: methylmalonyl Co-A mutase-associated GTPase MeaB [Rikenellaceae bacterium]|jgi:LAO/AO transport system kinase|nr:methylmalonyl Co-A mutase-associated GTPase MeaB [Rikenellaceae bacterium]
MTDHWEEHHRAGFEGSALTVEPGVGDAPTVNPDFRRVPRRRLTGAQYVEGILAGDVTVLSQAITLVESNNHAHYALAQEIIEKLLPHGGRSVRIGITGVPGAGKSTFIEAVGSMVVERGHKLAVLAVDPSSERSGGSILGDKTRMEALSVNPRVFIRPSPSAGELGGVARKSRETIVLCEAAGFDTVFIETVGVGQSETTVHSMVDLFMLLQIAGAGDELQGIKRGIMEMADLVAITKADGENVLRAGLAKTQFVSALSLFPMPESGLRAEVYTCSAVTGDGLSEVWAGVEAFVDHVRRNGYFDANRNRQKRFWMIETIEEALRNSFYGREDVARRIKEYEQQVLDDRISPFVAARQLLEMYFGQ